MSKVESNRGGRFLRIMVWGALLALASCTSLCGKKRTDMKPEEVVEAYLNVALNMTDVSQRQNLLEFTSGNLNAAIAEVSDDTIRLAYIDRKYELKSYSLLERRDRTPRETEVFFQLKYHDYSQGTRPEEAALITTDNAVRLIYDKSTWYITDVIGNKTSMEFPDLKELEIRAKAP